jgi:hypothetical protein
MVAVNIGAVRSRKSLKGLLVSGSTTTLILKSVDHAKYLRVVEW